MNNLLEYIWDNVTKGGYAAVKEGDTPNTFSNEVATLKEGIYIFREFNGVYHPTPIQRELFVLSVGKLVRYHDATTRIERDSSKDWLLKVDSSDSVIGKAIQSQFMNMPSYRGVDLFKHFDIQVTVKAKATVERVIKPFTKTDFNKAFKKITFVPDENGMTNEVIEDIDLFIGMILKSTTGGNYVVDLGDFYIRNRDEVHFSDLVELMNDYARTMTYSQSGDISPEMFTKRITQAEKDKLNLGEKVRSDMRSLTRALDLQTKGKIKVRQPASISEESTMINKLVAIAKNCSSPVNHYDQMYRDLESIYDPDSIDHVIKTNGDAMAVKGKLYIRLGDKFYWNIATVNSNSHSVTIHEPMLVNELYGDYAASTVDEYLANWINVNDLGIRL